jgi:hypothetical protein
VESMRCSVISLIEGWELILLIVAIVRNKTILFRIDSLPALKDKDFYPTQTNLDDLIQCLVYLVWQNKLCLEVL